MRSIAPFVLLGLAEIVIFFHDPQRFFIADTLIWMHNRYHSLGEFFSGLMQVDPGLWYRPLSQRTVPSLLFPFGCLIASLDSFSFFSARSVCIFSRKN
jgi:hypothetical protein